MAKGTEQDDSIGMSIRLKHGTHTIFLFVDPAGPFSKVTDELLELLRERYPIGLSQSNSHPGRTRVPDAGEEVRVSYAVLNRDRDLLSGWKNLRVEGNDTPVDKKLKDNMVVAFALQTGDMDMEGEPRFEVGFPELEEEQGGVSE